jgi:hypothetical protein
MELTTDDEGDHHLAGVSQSSSERSSPTASAVHLRRIRQNRDASLPKSQDSKLPGGSQERSAARMNTAFKKTELYTSRARTRSPLTYPPPHLEVIEISSGDENTLATAIAEKAPRYVAGSQDRIPPLLAAKSRVRAKLAKAASLNTSRMPLSSQRIPSRADNGSDVIDLT